jgi:hypothetical protein
MHVFSENSTRENACRLVPRGRLLKGEGSGSGGTTASTCLSSKGLVKMKKERDFRSASISGLAMFVSVAAFHSASRASEPSTNQRLIIACYRLNISSVKAELANGANVNARAGDCDPTVFQDRWSNSVPFGTTSWTPLLALASASTHPDPPRRIDNTVADIEWALAERGRVSQHKLRQRADATREILELLLSRSPDLDLHDRNGSTALYVATDLGKDEMAIRLIQEGASVNTRTRAYIDGPSGTTPLHVACKSAEVTELLLERGADPMARDSRGRTPIAWAKNCGVREVLEVYRKHRLPR